jgi:hypothetical protein
MCADLPHPESTVAALRGGHRFGEPLFPPATVADEACGCDIHCDVQSIRRKGHRQGGGPFSFSQVVDANGNSASCDQSHGSDGAGVKSRIMRLEFRVIPPR